MIHDIITVPWRGSIPGYGAVSQAGWAISVPNEQRIVFSFTGPVALPDVANWVALSDSGNFAWQSHSTGEIYVGTTPTGKKGYGQHSILYIGDDLQVLETVEAYQATAGGWAYVGESGQIVPYGSIYSGPPLWERVDFHDISIGQGALDGLCVHVPGESGVRVIAPGSYFNTQVHRSGNTFTILAVCYPGGFTRVWEASLEDLMTLPLQDAHRTPQDAPGSTIPTGPVGGATSMSTPLEDRIYAKLVEERQKLPNNNSPEALGAMLNRVAYPFRDEGVGLEAKTSGDIAIMPDGTTISHDVLRFPGNVGRDMLGDAEGSAVPQLGAPGAADPAKFVRPIPPDGKPEPVPTPDPLPSTNDRDLLLALGRHLGAWK